MFATLVLLALLAADRSVATALPQPMEWPLPSEIETGAKRPITPAIKSTAPTPMINHRTLTMPPFVVGDFDSNQVSPRDHSVNPKLTGYRR